MAYYHTRKFLHENGLNLIHGIGKNNENGPIYHAEASKRISYLYNRVSNEYLCWLEGA